MSNIFKKAINAIKNFFRKQERDEQQESLKTDKSKTPVAKEKAEPTKKRKYVKKLHTRDFESLPGEEWRSVWCNANYEVSNKGRIYSRLSGRLIIGDKLGNVSLYRDKKCTTRSLARIIAETFMPLPEGAHNRNCLAIVIDGSKSLSVDNIKWVLRSEFQKKNAVYFYEYFKKKDEEERLREKEEKKESPIIESPVIIEPDEESFSAIIQLRKSGEKVRRYEDINEILDVHKTWEKDVISKCLAGFSNDAYGWRWVYEVDYEKK